MQDCSDSRSYTLLEATRLGKFQREQVPMVSKGGTARPVCSRANIPNFDQTGLELSLELKITLNYDPPASTSQVFMSFQENLFAKSTGATIAYHHVSLLALTPTSQSHSEMTASSSRGLVVVA